MMHHKAAESVALDVYQVQNAISENRILTAVQGVHSVQDVDTILYGECLARLMDLSGTIRGAGEFIPILEVKRRTQVLDMHMLKLVLDELEVDPLAVLGCNLSADSLRSKVRWNAIYKQILSRYHLAERLVLEITETRPLCDIQVVNDRIAMVRNLGCRIAIDDFGSGLLTPSQLLKLDVDIVKIDAAFVYQIKRNLTDINSLQHIIGMAKCCAPTVVVEGVETEENFLDVSIAGATHMQGFYLSRPALLERS